MDYKGILQYIETNDISLKSREDIDSLLDSIDISVKSGSGVAWRSALIKRFKIDEIPDGEDTLDIKRIQVLECLYKQATSGDVQAQREYIRLCDEQREDQEIPQEILTAAQEACKNMVQSRSSEYCPICKKLYIEDMEGLLNTT